MATTVASGTARIDSLYSASRPTSHLTPEQTANFAISDGATKVAQDRQVNPQISPTISPCFRLQWRPRAQPINSRRISMSSTRSACVPAPARPGAPPHLRRAEGLDPLGHLRSGARSGRSNPPDPEARLRRPRPSYRPDTDPGSAWPRRRIRNARPVSCRSSCRGRPCRRCTARSDCGRVGWHARSARRRR